MAFLKKICLATSALTLVCSMTLSAYAAGNSDPGAFKRRYGQTEYYVKEFEKEVALQRGGEKMIWRNRDTALKKVKALMDEFPNEPEANVLYERTKTALMKSMGQFSEVDPSWTAYLNNEENLKKTIAAEASKEWNNFISKIPEDQFIKKIFPIPNSKQLDPDSIIGKYVVLEDVLYPTNQFYGATGEYIHVGKPSSGYYFVSIDDRDWLGPYEAIKRFRRNVDTSLADVTKWTVLGEITTIIAEVPDASESKLGSLQRGWVVKPVALYVPDHVMSFYDAEAESSGRYVGEDKVLKIKDSWFTVKEVPNDVEPERLMEIFMTAIKEKNYDLYRSCINPERMKTPTGEELVRYHWDLHQERFHGEYVHATFEKAKVTVISGFDDSNELYDFFLDDSQKSTLNEVKGEKVLKAVVESRALNNKGQQIGTPHPHTLVKHGSGRWYIDDYAARF